MLARSLIETSQPRVVFIDLTAGEMAAPGALIAYQKLAGPDAWFVAFGPHVEAEALAAAKAAGCQVVLAPEQVRGRVCPNCCDGISAGRWHAMANHLPAGNH